MSYRNELRSQRINSWYVLSLNSKMQVAKIDRYREKSSNVFLSSNNDQLLIVERERVRCRTFERFVHGASEPVRWKFSWNIALSRDVIVCFFVVREKAICFLPTFGAWSSSSSLACSSFVVPNVLALFESAGSTNVSSWLIEKFFLSSHTGTIIIYLSMYIYIYANALKSR